MSALPAWIKKRKSSAEKNIPPEILALKDQQWEKFVANGLPTKKNERFKYTDLTFLEKEKFVPARPSSVNANVINQHRLRSGNNAVLVFVNGYFNAELSDTKKLPEEVIVCSLKEAYQTHAELIKSHWASLDVKKYPFAALNTALCDDGLFFYLPEGCELKTTIHVLFIMTKQNNMHSYVQQLFILGKLSKLNLVEEFYSANDQAYLMNNMLTIFVGEDAELQHYKLQQASKKGVHLSHTFIQQLRFSEVQSLSFIMGSEFSRHDVEVNLHGTDANCKLNGFYHLEEDNQYIDHHIDINHAAPHSESEMLYKGIVRSKARAVFNGRLHVAPHAQKITAYQANHNLLLSNQAEVYSKPELEIYADDVKCKHGATTGEIDQEALFYLRSRGISQDEAVEMLLVGFLAEIAQRIKHEGVWLRVQEMVQ